MYRKPEVIPEAVTGIWSCSNDKCSCWMRDNFSFENTPVCPLCHSAMISEERVLPILTNYTQKLN